jgi:ABC-type transporter Mla subunit MlaD
VSAAGSGAAAPDDAQELKEEIGSTREQLGATVEQLAAKVDVPSRARAKAAELAGRVKNTTAPVFQAAPDPVRQAVAKMPGSTRQQRMALAATSGVLIAVAIWLWRRR